MRFLEGGDIEGAAEVRVEMVEIARRGRMGESMMAAEREMAREER